MDQLEKERIIASPYGKESAMRKKRFQTILILICILCFAPVVRGQMQSTNYRITASVLSGGGAAMASASFNMDATMGQSTALMNAADPPWSPGYDLYPGFWYTITYYAILQEANVLPGIPLLLLSE